MGIRFECPNGHRLNVKSHLAGKRGICPECQAKFTIPTRSNGTAEAGESMVIPSEEASKATAPTVDMPTLEEAPSPPESPPPPSPVASQSTPAPPPLPPAVSTMPDVWYVRATSGEQFGPANTETFNGWVASGRVPGDSLVWRTGWPDWKNGAQALTELNLPLVPPTDYPAVPIAAPNSVQNIDEQLTAEPLPAENYRIKQRKRRERAKLLTLSLSAVVFLLLVLLVVVLARN